MAVRWRRRSTTDVDDCSFELGNNAREGQDIEHPLTPCQKIDDVAVGVGEHRPVSDQHQLRRSQVSTELAP